MKYNPDFQRIRIDWKLPNTSCSRVNAPVQYGHGVKTLSVLLNVDYRIPFKKIQTLFGYAINESTVYSASRQCYKRLKETIEIIKLKIIEAITAHADETGMRVEESLRWLHAATIEMYTYLFVHEKKLNPHQEKHRARRADINEPREGISWSA